MRRSVILLSTAISTVLLLHGVTQIIPSVRSRGELDVPQTYRFDLDDGKVARQGQPGSSTDDFWYEAATPTTRYLVPVGGALLVVVGNKSLGYAGCTSTSRSRKKIDLATLRNGDFLCARTDDGRIAEFSFQGLYVKDRTRPDVLTLAITYTTWER